MDLVFKMFITFFFFSKFIHDLYNCLYTLVIPSMTDHQTKLSVKSLNNCISITVRVNITTFLYIGTSTILHEVARKIFFTDH